MRLEPFKLQALAKPPQMRQRPDSRPPPIVSRDYLNPCTLARLHIEHSLLLRISLDFKNYMYHAWFIEG